MLCTATPGISSSSENINSTARVSRLLSVSYDYDDTETNAKKSSEKENMARRSNEVQNTYLVCLHESFVNF